MVAVDAIDFDCIHGTRNAWEAAQDDLYDRQLVTVLCMSRQVNAAIFDPYVDAVARVRSKPPNGRPRQHGDDPVIQSCLPRCGADQPGRRIRIAPSMGGRAFDFAMNVHSLFLMRLNPSVST
ncbi:hypothetical protein V4C85_23150 [Ralstonia solanacearum]|uniref:hypothetical protein n=1 Tax=Ralstonia solanacearum TaxID=305 RepID=UPI001E4934B4|nr:hypothetical protein [Ralstonia solanacearum]